MKTQVKIKSACAMTLAIVLSASADIHSLPTPPPSDFVDAESSLTVPLPATEGRHIRLTLAFDPSPTNAVQVAFGIDANHDNDLAPEETALRVGIDCGQPLWNLSTDRRSLCVAKSLEWWHLARSTTQPKQESTLHSSTSTSNFDYSSTSNFDSTIELQMPRSMEKRWTHAKITTHNLTTTNLTITANYRCLPQSRSQ